MHTRAKTMRPSGVHSEGATMARLAAALNPQLELVTFDEPPGTISLRDRASGKLTVYRYRFDRSKNEFALASPDGTGVSFKAGTPGPGSLEHRYPEFTIRTGEAAERSTGWIPVYPGANPSPMGSITGKGATAYSFWFNTKDTVGKVLGIYSEVFKKQGFAPASTAAEPDVLAAEAESGKRNIQIRATRQGGLTHVIVYAVEKQ
jgi:hypothetical protein